MSSYLWPSSKRWTDNPGDRIIIPHEFSVSGTGGASNVDYPAGIDVVERCWLSGVGDPILDNDNQHLTVENTSATVDSEAVRNMTAYLVINPTDNPDLK